MKGEGREGGGEFVAAGEVKEGGRVVAQSERIRGEIHI